MSPPRDDTIRVRDLRPAKQRRAIRRRRRAALAALGLAAFVVGLAAGAGSGGPTDPGGSTTGARSYPGTPRATRVAADRRAVDGVLAYTPYISVGSPRKREVALTFDDGPGPYTARVAAILRAHRAPATFFVIGQQVTTFAPLLRKLVGEGFVVGDHTETHPMMARLGPRDQSRQVDDQAALAKAAGIRRERLFRPPFGSFDRWTLKVLRERRMLMVLWDVDTADYARPGADAIVRCAVRGAKPGSIILMHDGGGDRSQTVAALPRIIRGLRARRLRPVTVPQLLLDDPPPRNQGRPPTNLSGG